MKCPGGEGGLGASKEYHNFKNFYSIVLMGMVDSKYRFIWASCGYPGNCHDSIIIQSTFLGEKLKQGDTIRQIVKSVDGVDVPPPPSWRLGISIPELVNEALYERCPDTEMEIF